MYRSPTSRYNREYRQLHADRNAKTRYKMFLRWVPVLAARTRAREPSLSNHQQWVHASANSPSVPGDLLPGSQTCWLSMLACLSPEKAAHATCRKRRSLLTRPGSLPRPRSPPRATANASFGATGVRLTAVNTVSISTRQKFIRIAVIPAFRFLVGSSALLVAATKAISTSPLRHTCHESSWS